MNDSEMISELNSRFGIPNHINIDAGFGGLPRINITTALAEAQVYLHGAHVTHYARPGQAQLLFMSEKSLFAAEKPIRGGIPICFPWFGDHPTDQAMPAHGFARVQPWTLTSAEIISNTTAHLVLELESDEQTRKLWPYDFVARYTIMIDTQLKLALHVRNTGDKPLRFEEALHTYLSVDDIRHTTVSGLAGAHYVDKTRNWQRLEQTAPAIAFTEETDRIYQDNSATCVATDSSTGRTIEVDKDNSVSTIVWNPWMAKAKAMADFGDEEWTKMLCVETANVKERAIDLPPGTSHTMSARIKGI